ncbi:unnamed protein product [Acanthosepion pharaonis]|uniref:Uncharacterized protein n=1 Tax=Acanthosepion pharaonis TaxID=158019 RepID=A0A812CXF7_ACAPH|nr:unnamed protein product [Sepia pharaonis]
MNVQIYISNLLIFCFFLSIFSSLIYIFFSLFCFLNILRYSSLLFLLLDFSSPSFISSFLNLSSPSFALLSLFYSPLYIFIFIYLFNSFYKFSFPLTFSLSSPSFTLLSLFPFLYILVFSPFPFPLPFHFSSPSFLSCKDYISSPHFCFPIYITYFSPLSFPLLFFSPLPLFFFYIFILLSSFLSIPLSLSFHLSFPLPLKLLSHFSLSSSFLSSPSFKPLPHLNTPFSLSSSSFNLSLFLSPLPCTFPLPLSFPLLFSLLSLFRFPLPLSLSSPSFAFLSLFHSPLPLSLSSPSFSLLSLFLSPLPLSLPSPSFAFLSNTFCFPHSCSSVHQFLLHSLPPYPSSSCLSSFPLYLSAPSLSLSLFSANFFSSISFFFLHFCSSLFHSHPSLSAKLSILSAAPSFLSISSPSLPVSHCRSSILSPLSIAFLFFSIFFPHCLFSTFYLSFYSTISWSVSPLSVHCKNPPFHFFLIFPLSPFPLLTSCSSLSIPPSPSLSATHARKPFFSLLYLLYHHFPPPLYMKKFLSFTRPPLCYFLIILLSVSFSLFLKPSSLSFSALSLLLQRTNQRKFFRSPLMIFLPLSSPPLHHSQLLSLF